MIGNVTDIICYVVHKIDNLKIFPIFVQEKTVINHNLNYLKLVFTYVTHSGNISTN